MNKILFGISFKSKFNDDCFTSGSVRYLSKDYLILDVNNENVELRIERSKIEQIKLLRKKK